MRQTAAIGWQHVRGNSTADPVAVRLDRDADEGAVAIHTNHSDYLFFIRLLPIYTKIW